MFRWRLVSGIIASLVFDVTRPLPCHIEGAPLWCAFFILKRLKKAGYSNCRVFPEAGRLRIEGQR